MTSAPASDTKPGSKRGSLSLRRTSAALLRGDIPSWAPLIAALSVDLADFATAGPLGLVAGLFVGASLPGLVSFCAGAPTRRALLLALFGGLYCALPLTEALPFATMLTLLHTWLSRRNVTAEDGHHEASAELGRAPA